MGGITLSPRYAPALSYYTRTGLLEMVSVAGLLLSAWANAMGSGTSLEQPGNSCFSPLGFPACKELTEVLSSCLGHSLSLLGEDLQL